MTTGSLPRQGPSGPCFREGVKPSTPLWGMFCSLAYTKKAELHRIRGRLLIFALMADSFPGFFVLLYSGAGRMLWRSDSAEPETKHRRPWQKSSPWIYSSKNTSSMHTNAYRQNTHDLAALCTPKSLSTHQRQLSADLMTTLESALARPIDIDIGYRYRDRSSHKAEHPPSKAPLREPGTLPGGPRRPAPRCFRRRASEEIRASQEALASAAAGAAGAPGSSLIRVEWSIV